MRLKEWNPQERNKENFKEVGNSFQQASYSYFLKDEYVHCLPSDATIIVSYKLPIIGKQFSVTFLYNRLPSNNMTC